MTKFRATLRKSDVFIRVTMEELREYLSHCRFCLAKLQAFEPYAEIDMILLEKIELLVENVSWNSREVS